MSKKFIKTNDGHIYKRTSNEEVYLKVSPYEIGEDRRINSNVLFQMIKDGNASIINKKKAFEEINALWRDYEKEWVYNGNVYKIKKEHFCFSQAKEHKFPHTYIGHDNERHTYVSRYFLCMFHGKLCWVQHTQYYPRIELYKFTNLDTEPSYTDFIQWTSIKNIKNVYWKNFEGKWEIV